MRKGRSQRKQRPRSSFAPVPRPESDSRATIPAPAPPDLEPISGEAPTREMPVPAFALAESEAAETSSDPPPSDSLPAFAAEESARVAAPEAETTSERSSSDRPNVDDTIEESVPPMGDLVVHESVAEKFFSEGDLQRHGVRGEGEELDEVLGEIGAERAKAKSAPHVVVRRARFARVVTGIAVVAGVLCVAALVRTVVASRASGVPPHAAVTAVETKAIEPALSVAAPETPSPVDKAAEKAAEPAPVETAPVAAATDQAPSPAAPTGNALAAKNAARAALEQGRTTEAIAAGERSVAADPEDGEAWLLLGAAYQESGKMADAHRCYASCLKEGKRGPKGECAAMLR